LNSIQAVKRFAAVPFLLVFHLCKGAASPRAPHLLAPQPCQNVLLKVCQILLPLRCRYIRSISSNMRSTLVRSVVRPQSLHSTTAARGLRKSSVLSTAATSQTCTARPHAIATTTSYKTGREHFMTTSTEAKMNDSLPAIFADAEATFPPRFRERGWYLTVVRPQTSPQ
jgi:hypothetical protein